MANAANPYITPNPAIHNEPPQANPAQQKAAALGASLVQAMSKNTVNLMTSGALGGPDYDSSQAQTHASNWWSNFLQLIGVPDPPTTLTTDTSEFSPQAVLTWWQQFINAIVGAPEGSLGQLINNVNYGIGTIDPARITHVPAGAIGVSDPVTNLILNGSFDDVGSMQSDAEWVWDGTVDHTGTPNSGSAKAICDGSLLTLMSHPIAVSAGQTFDFSGWVKWDSFAGTPIYLGLQTYLNGQIVSNPFLDSISSPGASSDWTELSVSGWPVPSGIDTIKVVCGVLGTAGNVWFDDLSAMKTGIISGDWVKGIEDTIAADVQLIVDYIHQAVNGGNATGNSIHTVVQNLKQIPANSIKGDGTSTSVIYDATGAGSSVTQSSGYTLSTSWSHTVGAGANYALVGLGVGCSSTDINGLAGPVVTFGGVPMSCLGAEYIDNGTITGAVIMYGLPDPPTGTQTVAVTVPQSPLTLFPPFILSLAGNSISYSGWGSTAEEAGLSSTPTSNALALTGVPSATNHMVAQAFFVLNNFGASESITGYTKTQRWVVNNIDGDGNGHYAFILGDAAGAATVDFAATAGSPSGNTIYQAIAIDLTP